MRIELEPTLYSNIIDSMKSSEPYGAPTGTFYMLNNIIVPFRPFPTTFRVEVDNIGEPVTVEVSWQESPSTQVLRPQKPQVLNVVPTSRFISLPVQLGKGQNKITVYESNNTENVDSTVVYTTNIVALWESFAREFYTNVVRTVNNQRNSIASNLATRLYEPFLSFQKLLPETQSLQILATRLTARGLIHQPGTKSGVSDLSKAISLTTPVYDKMDKRTFDLEPALDPWTNTASQFAGLETHTWVPNTGIANWVAFIKYLASNPDQFTIFSTTENAVAFEYQGQIQIHVFDFDRFGTNTLTSLAREDCFRSVTSSASMCSIFAFKFCAASYTFDLYLTKGIGNCRVSFDITIPFDSGCRFDTDPIDPYGDGWLGWSLTGRFEQDRLTTHNLDTFVVAAETYPFDSCTYVGHYTQLLVNQRTDIEVDLTPVMDPVGSEISPSSGEIMGVSGEIETTFVP